MNVAENCTLNNDHYFQLRAELKRIYADYSFEIVPISVGATGLITKSLSTNLEKIGIEEIPNIIKQSQQKDPPPPPPPYGTFKNRKIVHELLMKFTTKLILVDIPTRTDFART